MKGSSEKRLNEKRIMEYGTEEKDGKIKGVKGKDGRGL